MVSKKDECRQAMQNHYHSEPRKILVTGAAGFVGSFLCDQLVQHEHSVVGIDNFFRGKPENIENLRKEKNFSFVELDLSLLINIEKIKSLISVHNINTIFHLAAINGTEYFYERPLFVLDQNIKITQNLLAALCSPVEYIIYTSSSEVYGNALEFPTKETHPILLNALSDRDSYAASKAIGDFYVRLFAKQNNMHSLILRIFNLYGERMDGTRYGQVVPEFVNRMLHEKEFYIIGNGSQTRSFCYIEDAVFAMRELMEKRVTGILNLGNDEEISIGTLANTIHELDNRKFNPVFKPERPNDHKRRRPDISCLISLLPELKFTPLKLGLKRVINFYKSRR